MQLKYKFKYTLDDPKRTLEHREIIKNKSFLRRLYTEWYQEFINEYSKNPKGKYVELGSGGGFLKNLAPGIITSDVLPLKDIDMSFSALEMPFANHSLDGIFMIDTFHHIPDSELFLKEARRTLKANGKIIMIEPVNSLWGQFIYKNFHHEPFNPKGSWNFPQEGPLSGANGALPWIVFERDKKLFNKKFPEFEIQEIKYHTPTRYLISGGLSFKQIVPDFSYSFIKQIDVLLSKISEKISMFMTVKLCLKN
jgi:SAM-dependent methyltransferase